MREKKYLLGANTYNEIVFGEFGVTKRNGYAEFTASFDTVRPFNGENFDLEEYYEGWIEGMDKEYLYDLCERFNCSSSELAENLANECYDVRDAILMIGYMKNWNFGIMKCNTENILQRTYKKKGGMTYG